ncbi:multidrug effflux MFS transporter [Novispirillum itersonii]|uniref:multidrug effflux MFS transporter n=1 Tax=Novispirillum itersonii TaxID=189 RepID=UPI000378465E|nr:multidrug effflux MFS transporter [Novispirillum itersonii]
MSSVTAPSLPPTTPQPGLGFLAPLVLFTTVGPVAMQMFLPALPAIQQDFGVTAAEAQMTISLALLSFGLSMLVYGPVSDRFGRRRPLQIGMFLYCAGCLLCTIASSLDMLIAGRVLAAIGGAGGMTLTRAMVRDTYPPSQVAPALSQLMIGQIVPPMLAPVLGGLIAVSFGWRAIFITQTAVACLALLLVLRLPETLRERHIGASPLTLLTNYGALLRHPRFNAFTLFNAVGIGGYFLCLAGAPLVLINALHLSPADYGLIFILVPASFMLGNILTSRLARRFAPRVMIPLGAVFSLAGPVVGLVLVMFLPLTPWSVMIPAGIMTFGHGLSMSSAQAASMAVRPALAGAAAGLGGFLQMAVGALVTQGFGLIHDGTATPLLAGMAISSLSAVAVYGGCLMLDRRRSPGRAD